MRWDTIISDVPEIIGCFGSFRRPSWGWSGPNLCPSSANPLLRPFNPNRPRCSFCGFCDGLNSSPLCSSYDAEQGEALTQGAGGKASAPHLNGFAANPPTSPPALLYELLILKPLALISLFHMFLPWDCQFQQENLLRWGRCQHHIWS